MFTRGWDQRLAHQKPRCTFASSFKHPLLATSFVIRSELKSAREEYPCSADPSLALHPIDVPVAAVLV
jgi:hypothetical protein